MRKIITSLWCVAAMSSATYTARAATDADGNNCIYVAGLVSTPPNKQYADEFETSKMFETSPGSNIYEGRFDVAEFSWGGYFRFYYDLTDVVAPGDLSSYRLNVLQPKSIGGERPDGRVMRYAGSSKVYKSDDVDKIKMVLPGGEGTWRIPIAKYKFRVDLNDNTFTAIPEGTVLVLVNDEDVSVENIADKIEISSLKHHYEGGELRLRLYDVYNEKWLNPSPGAETQLSTTLSHNHLYVEPSDKMGEPFRCDDWTGGLVSGEMWISDDNHYVVKLLLDTPVEEPIRVDMDEISIAGDFNNWQFASVRRQEDAGADVFKFTFPAGTREFKVILGNSWGCSQLAGNGEVSTDGDMDVYGLRISKPENNLENSRFLSTLTEDVEVTLDFAQGTLTVPHSAGVYLPTVAVGGRDPIDRNTLFMETAYDAITPYAGCSDAVLSAFPGLIPGPDGEYTGYFYVPAGEFSLRFLGSLSPKGMPNMVIAPPGGADREIVISNGEAWSRAELLPADRAGYWTCHTDLSPEYRPDGLIKNWQGGFVSVTVTIGAETAVKFKMEDPYYIDPDVQQTWIYSVSGMYGHAVTDNRSMSSYDPVADEDGSGYVRLFSRKLPISPEEPEWEGSYAICPAEADAEVTFDDLYVAEMDFVTQDYVTAGGGAPFRFAADNPFRHSHGEMYVDYTLNKVYFAPSDEIYYLCGGLTDGRRPTPATRGDFRDVAIPTGGGIVDMPAGKFDFCMVTNLDSTYDDWRDYEVEFVDGLALRHDEYGFYRFIYDNVKCPDWKGGKVLVSEWYMLDMSTVSEITAVTIGNDQKPVETVLKPVAEGSLVFKGKLPVNSSAPTMRFKIRVYTACDGTPSTISVTSAAPFHLFGGGIANVGDDVLVPSDGVMTGKLGFDCRPFSMPSVVAGGEMEVTVDLDAMTLAAVVSPESEGPIYESVSEKGGDLDGVMAYPSAEQDGAVVLSATVDAGTEDCGFNFSTPQGEVIQPAAGVDTPVTFDQTGVWSGEFVKKAAPSASRRAVRAAAAQDAKWSISMPEGVGGALSMLIDEKNSRLTIASSAHNEGYFIVTMTDGEYADTPCVENIATMRRSMLTRSGDGLCRGELTVPESGHLTMAFVNDCNLTTGVFTPLYTLDTFDLTEQLNKALPALDAVSGNPPTMWQVTAPAGKVEVAFDPADCSLTLCREKSAVESVAADSSDRFAVSGGVGCVTVTTASPLTVGVYTVDGRLVKSLDLGAGATRVDLPAGLYVVGSTKVVVR